MIEKKKEKGGISRNINQNTKFFLRLVSAMASITPCKQPSYPADKELLLHAGCVCVCVCKGAGCQTLLKLDIYKDQKGNEADRLNVLRLTVTTREKSKDLPIKTNTFSH